MENKPTRYKEYKVLSLDAKGEIKDKIASDRETVSIYPHEAERQNANFRTNKFWYEVDMEFEDSLNVKSAVRLEADELGVKYRDNISDAKLQEKINAHKNVE